jgi:DNA-binding transcriptional regulator LsrR (DeoR family)
MNWTVTDTLTSLVAVLHHQKGLPQNEIARRLTLSNMKVSRLVQRARETGIVKTEVRLPFSSNDALAERLAAEYQLGGVLVVGAAHAGEPASELIGRAWAFTFSASGAQDAILGLGLGETVGHGMRELPVMAGAAQHVVQVIGGLPGAGTGNPFSIIQEACRKLGASGTFLSSNALAGSREARDQFLASPAGMQCARMWEACTEVWFGVGSLARGGFLSPELVSSGEVAELERLGVLGDVLGHCFNSEGELLQTDLADRLVSIPRHTLRRVPRRIALAGGPGKESALRAALRTGLITELVTDELTAMRLLEP